jgi:anti-anti-sigma regulatory factor
MKQLSLPAELTVYSVAALKPQWLDCLDGDPDTALCVDASAAADIDAAGVQLLMALDNALRNRRRRLRLVEPSDALRGACAALGASQLLVTDPDLHGAQA